MPHFPEPPSEERRALPRKNWEIPTAAGEQCCEPKSPLQRQHRQRSLSDCWTGMGHATHQRRHARLNDVQQTPWAPRTWVKVTASMHQHIMQKPEQCTHRMLRSLVGLGLLGTQQAQVELQIVPGLRHPQQLAQCPPEAAVGTWT